MPHHAHDSHTDTEPLSARIQDFTTHVVAVPREPGATTDLSDRPPATVFVTLQLRTNDGVEGIGHATLVPWSMNDSLKAAVDALAQEVVGRNPMDIESIVADLYWAAGAGSTAGVAVHAIAAIEVALWDIRGKMTGQPVHKLLGGFADRVKVYASGSLWRPHRPEDIPDAGRAFVEQGFRAMKLRVGGESNPAKEVERLRLLREAVGEDVDLMVDVNRGWSVNEAVTIGKRLEEYAPHWLEDPIDHHDLEGQARVADALTVPIAAGEYHYGIEPFRYMLERRSIDVVMIDLMRVGGLTRWMKVAHLAEAFNVPVVSHLVPEFLCHAMAAIPNGIYTEYMPWSLPLYKETPRIEDGDLVLPQAPGLGLEFDEDAIQLYRMD